MSVVGAAHNELYSYTVQVQVFRMFQAGQPLDRELVRRSRPAVGDLRLRVRLTGRKPWWDVYLATLEHKDHAYVIPCLDLARVLAIRGGWLHIGGTEVHPHKKSIKSQGADRFPQEWWCRLLPLSES